MFKGLLFASLFSFAFTSAQAQVSHAIWDGLLKKHVDSEGWVDYKGFVKDSARLNQYLDLLSANHPKSSWSKAEQKAYWINAYNAFTVKLIVDHYPIASIKDIKRGIVYVNTVWDIKFIEIEGQTYDLNKIEHGILRKDFKDARIHAAVNCASYSCPKLWGEAFVAPRLEQQLDEAMQAFVNDPVRNKVSANSAELSQIFNWYGSDFKDEAGTIQAYINKYAKVKLASDGKISFREYIWTLNDQK